MDFNRHKLIIIGALAGITLIVVLGWAYFESTRPLPGIEQEDQGRGHVANGTVVDYQTNPPTSGSHYTEWAKAGIYDNPLDNRNLVHSLEHGYVVVSYNCDFKAQTFSIIPLVIAQEMVEMEEATDSSEIASQSASLSLEFQSDQCVDLKNMLKQIYEDKGSRKIIMVPDPNLDTKIALSAWRRLDKFNPSAGSGLSAEDKRRIENFIDKLRDRGPEWTME